MNEPARIAPKFFTRLLGPRLHRLGVDLIRDKMKPLIDEDNFNRFIDSATKVVDFDQSLMRAFPEYGGQEVKLDQRKRDIYSHMTRNISKMTIAKYIIKKTNFKPDIANINKSIDDFLTAANITLINNYLITDGLLDKRIGKDKLLAILRDFININAWPRPYTEQPSIRKGKCIVNLIEISIILAIHEFNNSDKRTSIQSLFETSIRRLDPRAGVKVSAKAQMIEIGTSIIADIKPDYVLDIELLFNYNSDNIKHLASVGGALPAFLANNRGIHHVIYLGSNYTLDVWPQKIEAGKPEISNYVSIKDTLTYLKNCRNASNSIYVFDYRNYPSNSFLQSRAIWCLGEYKYYNLLNENCESYVNWVFQNRGADGSEYCSISDIEHETYLDNDNIKKFWNNILQGGFTRTIEPLHASGVNATIFTMQNAIQREAQRQIEEEDNEWNLDHQPTSSQLINRLGGYRATRKNRNLLRILKKGESIGFTATASLKAKGLIPRTSRKFRGKKVLGPKYR